jgi:hypothetical protein
VTVSGLTFKPSFLILKTQYASPNNDTFTIYTSFHPSVYDETVFIGQVGGSSGSASAYKANVSPSYVTSTGFCLPATYSGAAYDWIAIE